MDVRFESMVCLWDDKIPTMFLEFMNLLTFCQSEEQLRAGVKDFSEKHELDKFFLYGFGSHHFYLHQRYTSNPEMVMQNRVLSVHFNHLKTTIMSTRMTINGVSTCTKAGTEKYEKFQTGIGRRKRTLVQYDYRHTDGELFSCVKPTLDECRTARDKWLTAKRGKEDKR